LSAARSLIVNADDFGFTRDVNDGIIEAHRRGIVTATTLMAGGAAFAHAVDLARDAPTLDVGCHLVLVGGVSVLPPHQALPASVSALLGAIAFHRISVYEEFRAQVRRILDAGIRPTHLDTHKHTHVLPQVAEAMARISEEFGIAWVRRPLAGPLLGWILRRRHCRMTDHFAGFRLTGRLDAAALTELIRRLQPGTTELMCHPGFLREELRRARTRLKESRERELRALVAPEVRQAILEAGIELTNYLSLLA